MDAIETGALLVDHPLEARAVVGTVLRALGTAVTVLFLYFVLPLERDLDPSVVLVLGAGLVVLGVVLTMQVRAILHAAHPGLRAIEALGAFIPLFLVVFSVTYLLMARLNAEAFTQPLTRIDALYFTVTVFATVGFGDIAARSQPARVVVTLQMVGDLIVLGIGLRVIVGAVKLGQERRSAGVPPRAARRRSRRPDGSSAGPSGDVTPDV